MIKNKNVAKLLLIVGILCSILGVSYALFIKNLSGSNNNSLTATCFNVTFTDQNNIGLTNTYPLLDEEGKKLKPYEFTVTNNCDTFVKYDINLEVLNTSTLTNMDYIKLMLDDGAPALVSRYDVTTKTLSNASSAYKIKSDLYLDAKESKTYKLRLWLDENVTTETEGVQNKSFASKITVNASYAKELPEYCDLHSDTMACQVTTLAKTDTTNLAVDDYGNTRYIGANPNNYVSIDGDIWRIIGTMKSVDDGTGNKEDRVKLIRSESIGSKLWDSSESSINSGWGVNEWSQADLMKLLNPGYENETVGGSLYWNSGAGECYSGQNNETTSCNFTSTGIKDKLKTLISDAVWNTGASTTPRQIASKFYTEERGTRNGKICTSGDECNDTVTRTTTWTGKIGLMYPSDYGYATSGGSTTDRTTCLNKELRNWDSESVSDCKNNDWLFNNSYQWTLSPRALSSNANGAFIVRMSGDLAVGAYSAYGVRPVVYLTSNVKISGGEGTSELPFSLEL